MRAPCKPLTCRLCRPCCSAKCEVEGCRSCDGDATACEQCQQLSDNCEATYWFDPRTAACVKIDVVLDC